MFKIDPKSLYSLLAKIIIAGILFFVPIFFVYFYPLDLDLSKIVLFKTLLFLLLFVSGIYLFAYKIVIKKEVLNNFKPLFFLFIFLGLSLFFSVDFKTSWFGAYGRFEGLSSWLFYLLWAGLIWLYLGSQNEEEQKKSINYFLKSLVLSSALVSLYALLQRIGLDFVSWQEAPYLTGRAISSFGQPNYLATWLLLILPISAYLIYREQKNKLRIIWASIFALNLTALFLTGSRAIFLVFLLVSVIWLFAFLARAKRLSKKKIILILLAAVLLGGIFLTSLFVSNGARFQELLGSKRGSASDRLELWRSGAEAFVKKPLFGYGLENQAQAYVKEYKVDWALYSPPNVYTDRAHNLILDILLSSGVLGLLFFVYFYYWLFRNLLVAQKNKPSEALPSFLIWALVLYLSALMFNFSVTVTNIYFWFYLSLSLILSGKFSLIEQKIIKKNFLLSLALLIFLVSFVSVGVLKEGRRLEANYYYQEFFNSVSNSEYFVALAFKDYLDYTGPNKVDSDFYNRQTALTFVSVMSENDDPVVSLGLSNYLSQRAALFFSDNFENKFVSAFSLAAAGKKYESFLLFEELSLISPQMPKIYLAWGDSLLRGGDYELALEKLNQALNFLPNPDQDNLGDKQKNDIIIYQNYILEKISKAKELLK